MGFGKKHHSQAINFLLHHLTSEFTCNLASTLSCPFQILCLLVCFFTSVTCDCLAGAAPWTVLLYHHPKVWQPSAASALCVSGVYMLSLYHVSIFQVLQFPPAVRRNTFRLTDLSKLLIPRVPHGGLASHQRCSST